MLDLLLPAGCLACGRGCALLCPTCESGLEAPGPLVAPPGLDVLLAAFVYAGAGAALVAGLKHHGGRRARGPVAAAMAGLVAPAAVDLVTWAPTTDAHRRARGFDPAEVLARPVARRLGRPARPLLRRAAGRGQTGRSRAERLADPPRHHARSPVAGRVLLVDDVTTTGATLTAAAAALRAAGASRVLGLVAARTPGASSPARRPWLAYAPAKGEQPGG